jgi:phage shock protein C
MNDRLYRSRDDRMLAGVAAGIADYWDADPSLVRIIWALLVVPTGGVALLVYIIMAIVVPEEPYPVTNVAATAGAPTADSAASDTTTVTGPAPAAPAAAATPLAAPAPAAFAPPSAASYADEREARRAARAARRADRRANRSNTGPLLIGGFLVILGAFFLAREWFPQIDFDWFWPAMLIVIGILVFVGSLRREETRREDEDRGSSR